MIQIPKARDSDKYVLPLIQGKQRVIYAVDCQIVIQTFKLMFQKSREEISRSQFQHQIQYEYVYLSKLL